MTLRRAIQTSTTLVLAGGLLAASPAAACEVCYGPAASTSPMVSSVRLGVFLLLGVTIAMLGAFASFFVYLRNRARATESASIAAEWADFQRSSLT